jgi:hypothetical protein
MDLTRYQQYFLGGSFTGPDFKAQFSEVFLKELNLPTGRLVAADVVEGMETPAFDRRLTAGRYPVSVSVATLEEDDDQRVAAAIIRFSAMPPLRFELAKLEGDGPHSFAIDSSMGCYLDVKTLKALENMTDDQDEALVAELDRQYASHQVDTWSWTNLLVDPIDGLNVVSFSSGWGDEDYFSYWGFAGDEAVCLVTDFRLLDQDE